MPTKVSVILPTYEERGNIRNLSTELIKAIKKAGYSAEIIIVDDNSRDGTGEEAKRISRKRREVKAIIRNERGLATAILRGIREASGSVIVAMDADFSHPPRFVPHLLKGLDSADAVFASRYVKGGSMDADRAQYHLSKFLNYVIKWVLGIPVIDSTGGFFAIKKQALDGLNAKAIFHGYGDYCFRLIHALKSRKSGISEIPFRYMPRRYGTSKTRLLKAGVSYGMEALRLRLGL